MKNLDKVPETREGLQTLLDRAMGASDERLVAGIQCKRTKVADVQKITARLRDSRSILEGELIRLAEFAQVFNKLYATKDNTWFDSAKIMLKKLQSHYLRWREMLKFTSPRKSRKHRHGRRTPEPTIYETTSFNTNLPFQGDFFGLASYNWQVKELKLELEKFLSDMVNGIELCQSMLNEEDTIKKDPKWIKDIYEDCYNMTVAKNRDTIDWLVSIGRANTDNPLYQLMLTYKSKDKFIQEQFHKHSDVRFNDYVFADVVTTLMNNNISAVEQQLWGRDYDKIRMVRFVIAHFDELFTATGRRGYSGIDLMNFIVWCNVRKDVEVREDVERILYDYLRENYKGSTHMVGWSSVFDSRKLFPDGGDQRDVLIKEQDERIQKLYQTVKEKELGFPQAS